MFSVHILQRFIVLLLLEVERYKDREKNRYRDLRKMGIRSINNKNNNKNNKWNILRDSCYEISIHRSTIFIYVSSLADPVELLNFNIDRTVVEGVDIIVRLDNYLNESIRAATRMHSTKRKWNLPKSSTDSFFNAFL